MKPTQSPFVGVVSRGRVIAHLRERFNRGETWDDLYDSLRTEGYAHRTRYALLDDALSSDAEDLRTEEEKNEAQLLRKLKRANR